MLKSWWLLLQLFPSICVRILVSSEFSMCTFISQILTISPNNEGSNINISNTLWPLCGKLLIKEGPMSPPSNITPHSILSSPGCYFPYTMSLPFIGLTTQGGKGNDGGMLGTEGGWEKGCARYSQVQPCGGQLGFPNLIWQGGPGILRQILSSANRLSTGAPDLCTTDLSQVYYITIQ